MEGLQALSSDVPAAGRRRAWLIPLGSAALLLAGGLGGGLTYYRSLRTSSTIPGILLGRVRLASLDATQVEGVVRQEVDAFLDEPITLQLGAQTIRVTRREVGARVDVG